MVPESVDPARLTNAVGLNSIAFNVSRSVGPAVAGGLIALLGAGTSFLVQALLGALTVLWTIQLHLPNRAPASSSGRAASHRSFFASTVEGWRYMALHETIRVALLVAMMAQFFGMSFTTLLPVFARDVLGVGAAGQGFLLTAQGMGALCSAFLVAAMGDSLPRGKLMIAGVTVYGLLEFTFSTSHWFPVSVVLMALIGICHVSANALTQSVIQSNAAPVMRGRVMGAWQQVQVCMVTGGLLAGAATSIWGAPLTVAAMGTACALGAITIFLAIPHVRTIR
jgi:predicted MFS family arabinose efflux permease